MKIKAFIYIITAGVLWGTSGIFVHYLSPYGFTAFQMTGVRAIVSFTCIVTYAIVRCRAAFRFKPLNVLIFTGIGEIAVAFLNFSSLRSLLVIL